MQGVRAGFVSRFLGFLVDLLVLAVIGFLIVFFVAVAKWALTSQGFHFDRPSGIGVLIAEAILAILYFTYFWTTTGRTFGEQMLGLRVVREDGSRLRGGRAFVRSVLTVVFAIGVLWVLVSKRNAALQDLICRTAVIYDWSYHPPSA